MQGIVRNGFLEVDPNQQKGLAAVDTTGYRQPVFLMRERTIPR